MKLAEVLDQLFHVGTEISTLRCEPGCFRIVHGDHRVEVLHVRELDRIDALDLLQVFEESVDGELHGPSLLIKASKIFLVALLRGLEQHTTHIIKIPLQQRVLLLAEFFENAVVMLQVRQDSEFVGSGRVIEASDRIGNKLLYSLSNVLLLFVVLDLEQIDQNERGELAHVNSREVEGKRSFTLGLEFQIVYKAFDTVSVNLLNVVIDKLEKLCKIGQVFFGFRRVMRIPLHLLERQRALFLHVKIIFAHLQHLVDRFLRLLHGYLGLIRPFTV